MNGNRISWLRWYIGATFAVALAGALSSCLMMPTAYDLDYRSAKARLDLDAMRHQILLMVHEQGRYPPVRDGRFPLFHRGFGDFPGDEGGKSVVLGPWLDPWGYPFRYEVTLESRARSSHLDHVVFDLWSVGRDGVDGGGDDVPLHFEVRGRLISN